MRLIMDSAADDSAELPARLRRGDEGALAQAFSQHRPKLERMIQFRLDPRLHGRVDCEDVLQDAYLAAAQRLAHFADDSAESLFVWLRLIVAQTLVDVHRRHLGAQIRDAAREVSLHGGAGAQSTSLSLASLLAGSLTSPSFAAVRAETLQRLQHALDTMDPIDREVLALRHFEELSNSEVAAVLGIQQKAASIRYVRALKRLKEILAAWPEFSDGKQHDP